LTVEIGKNFLLEEMSIYVSIISKKDPLIKWFFKYYERLFIQILIIILNILKNLIW